MGHPLKNVNGTVAPLANISMLMDAVRRANESEGSERLLILYGHPGYGKTTAASFVANKLRGRYVEACSHWTKKVLLESILFEMGIPAKGTTNDIFQLVIDELARSGRPLIIDEADYLVKNSCIETIRDLHDKGRVVVILVGEEMMPRKLERWDRVHSRVLEFVAAEPADIEDLAHLCRLYCPGIEIAVDWLTELYHQTGGNIRRICNNLISARDEAQHLGRLDLASWGNRGWRTGQSPAARRAV